MRQVLQSLIDKHANVPKGAQFVYKGPLIGPTAAAVLKAWQDSPEAQVRCLSHSSSAQRQLHSASHVIRHTYTMPADASDCRKIYGQSSACCVS